MLGQIRRHEVFIRKVGVEHEEQVVAVAVQVRQAVVSHWAQVNVPLGR